MRQLWGEVAFGQTPLSLDSSAPVCSTLACSILPGSAQLHSALVQQDVFSVGSSAPVRETHSSRKGKVHFLSQRGADLFRQKSPPLVSNWLVLVKMSISNPPNWIGPKCIVLIVQIAATLIGQ